jgi:hypothetical protein
MNKTIKIILLLFSFNLLTSCFVGMASNSHFTYFNQQQKIEFEKNQLTASTKKIAPSETDAVLVYIEGEKLDFEFEKIGLIEVQGGQNSYEEDLMVDIKKLTLERHCDAIINFKKNYTDRESGILFSNEPLKKYTSKTFSGIAVKIIKK